MALWKKILVAFVVILVLFAGAVILFVGPWPAYTASFEGTAYFKRDMARIDEAARRCKLGYTPGPLKVGWGTAVITAPAGTPLAGYGARESKPSVGVHDDVQVKAVAISDGENTAVLVGSDLLIVPPNVADPVREAVAKETPLTADNIYFTASHTHDSYGGFVPGLVAYFFFGKYNPEVPAMVAKAFTSAILDAYKSMKPAKIAHGDIDVKELIHNRARNAGVDPVLNWMLIENEEGKRCYVVRFSGHATILDDDNMLVSAEYPGCLQRAIEKATGGTAVFLGGATCSMSPSAPDAPTAFDKCEAMGNVLAQRVLQATQTPAFVNSVDVVSIGVPVDLPPLQMRLWSTKWRLSPLSTFLTGLRVNGWMGAVRIGDMVFVNVPGELSGEIASDWREWVKTQNLDLWASGFSGDYAGYISPDRYYGDLRNEKGNLAYETGLMSWLGPHMEGFFTALMKHMVESIKAPDRASAPAT